MNYIKNILFTLLLLISFLSSNAHPADQKTVNSDSIVNHTNSIESIEKKEQIVGTESKESLRLNYFQSYPESQSNITPIYPPATRDFKKLTINTGLFIGTTVVVFGILYVLPESATQWDKEQMKKEGITQKWKSNVKKGPVIDNDNFFFNYVTHPWCGAGYYMTARSCGFKWYESFGYSVFMSTCFWEYGVEAFAEIPSVQDIIITPVVGSVFGEGCFYAKKSIIRHDKKILKSKILGLAALFCMDPFNTVVDGLGYKQKTKTSVSITPISYNLNAQKAVWGINLVANF